MVTVVLLGYKVPDQGNSPASLPSQNSRHCVKQACLTSSSEAAPCRQYIKGHVSWNYDRRLSLDFCMATGGFNQVVSLQLQFQHSPTDPVAFMFHSLTFFKQTTMPWQQHWAGIAWQRLGLVQIKAVSRFMWIRCVFQGSLHSWSHGCSLELRCNTRQLLYLSGH